MKMKRFYVALFSLLAMVAAAGQDAADPMMQEGSQFLREKKYEEAFKRFEKANKARGEKCASCLLRMAYAKMNLQDERAALKLTGRSLEVAANSQERADADALRGEVLLYFAGDNLKKLADAEQAFREASKEDPSAAIFHLKIGVTLIRQSKDEEGKKELQRYLEDKADTPESETVKKWIADPRRLRLNFAPDFTITTLKGETITLSQLAGRVVLLDFWGTWCPPCRASIPELQDMFKKYPSDKMVIISISSDQEEANWKQFVADHKMEWHQYIDLDKHVLKQYNVHAFPTYVLIDREGIIRERISGLEQQQSLGGRLKEPLKKVFASESAAR